LQLKIQTTYVWEIRRGQNNNNKKRKTAKVIDAGLRDHGASKDKICVAISNAVGVPISQLSQYVDSQLCNNMGEVFHSQYGLELAADHDLSLSQDEDDKTTYSKK